MAVKKYFQSSTSIAKAKTTSINYTKIEFISACLTLCRLK